MAESHVHGSQWSRDCGNEASFWETAPSMHGNDARESDLCRWSAATSGLSAQQFGDHHEIVGQHGGTHQQFEMCGTLDQFALHPAPTKQPGSAPFNAGA